MKTFDVQSVGIERPAMAVYQFLADPRNLPKWTNAFKRADETSAELATPNGAVPIQLKSFADARSATIDWEMTFPDGAVGTAYSRVTPDGEARSVYAFVLMAPPVPLEAIEGALGEQMQILAEELTTLKSLLEA